MNLVLIFISISAMIDCYKEEETYYKYIKGLIAICSFIPVYISLNILTKNRNCRFKYLLQQTIKSLNEDYFEDIIRRYYFKYMETGILNHITGCDGVLKRRYFDHGKIEDMEEKKDVICKRQSLDYHYFQGEPFYNDNEIKFFEEVYEDYTNSGVIYILKRNYTKIAENGNIVEKDISFQLYRDIIDGASDVYDIKLERNDKDLFNKEDIDKVKSFYKEEKLMLIDYSRYHWDGVLHKLNNLEKVFYYNVKILNKTNAEKGITWIGKVEYIKNSTWNLLLDIPFNPLSLLNYLKIRTKNDSYYEGYYWIE